MQVGEPRLREHHGFYVDRKRCQARLVLVDRMPKAIDEAEDGGQGAAIVDVARASSSSTWRTANSEDSSLPTMAPTFTYSPLTGSGTYRMTE